MRLKKYINL